MPYFGSILDLPKEEEMYSNNCVDGQCSGCGQCCADFLPLTKGELKIMKAYARKHGLKEHRQAPFWDPYATDLTCPFRNQHTRKCDIYAVRPQICRSFICSKTLMDAKNDRDLIHKTRKVYSLRYEIFGNPECISFLTAACAKVAGMIR